MINQIPTPEEVKEYFSSAKEVRCLNLDVIVNIKHVNRIDLRTLPISEEKRERISKPRKKEFTVNGIIATNLNTNEIVKFKSVKIASNTLGILQTAIHNNLNKRSNSTISKINKQKYKFIWDKNIS